MSVIPLCFNNTQSFLDQYFGRNIGMDDFFKVNMVPFITEDCWSQWKSKLAAEIDKGSKVTSDNEKYQVCIDVQQFSPEEITVKAIGRQIVIEGKHEEKQDEHGYISRNFVRKYVLPDDLKMDSVTSSISSDGVLSISVPKMVPAITGHERLIPIMQC